jgi:ABC-2 type transport system ATP-binding protein
MTGEEGWTVFLSSHDIEEVDRLADRVILIDSGKKRLDETVEALLGKCRSVEVIREETDTPFEPPKEWLDYREVGRTISFSVAEASEALEDEIKRLIPGADRIHTREMSLREVFVMMAQRFRIES